MNKSIAPTAVTEISRRILTVDDDPTILLTLRHSLEAAGFEVSEATSAASAQDWISRNGLPDLAIVDIMMPETSGIELCRELQRFSDLPIIFLTAIDEKSTVVQAIDELAEDYVTKPFHPDEVVARTRRVIRRIGATLPRSSGTSTVIDEHLAIDLVHKQARLQEQTVALTPTETKLLHILILNRPRTVRSDYLLRRVWPMEEVYEDSLRVHIHRLRHKIEPNPKAPRYLVTRRGKGYSFGASG